MWVAIREYIIIGGLILALLGAVWFAGYTKGHDGAKSACERAQAAADKKGVQAHVKVETKVKRLSDPDLDQRLSKWMRPD